MFDPPPPLIRLELQLSWSEAFTIITKYLFRTDLDKLNSLFIKFYTMVVKTCWWFHVNKSTSTSDIVQVHDDTAMFENPLCGERRVGAGRTSLRTINLSTIAKIINFAPHQPLGRAEPGLRGHNSSSATTALTNPELHHLPAATTNQITLPGDD